jgi:hypothetical protein
MSMGMAELQAAHRKTVHTDKQNVFEQRIGQTLAEEESGR